MLALALAGIAFVLGMVMLIIWQILWIVRKIDSLKDKSNLPYTDPTSRHTIGKGLYAMKRGAVASQPCGVVSLPRDATVQ